MWVLVIARPEEEVWERFRDVVKVEVWRLYKEIEGASTLSVGVRVVARRSVSVNMTAVVVIGRWYTEEHRTRARDSCAKFLCGLKA